MEAFCALVKSMDHRLALAAVSAVLLAAAFYFADRALACLPELSDAFGSGDTGLRIWFAS